jgi:signal transduction histidine kinase/ActR/RegA family two-component response regulator
LELLNSELERRVAERTAELAHTNAQLEQRVEQRTREREEALAQVHEMQKMESLGQLTGGVAHDFNNLLTAVMANLELIKKRVPENPAIHRLIDAATMGAQRGASLTKRMLAFARRQELKPATVELSSLINGMEDMLQRSLGPTINIETDLSLTLPHVRVDPHQFELALLNLAVNARDAMPDGGRLTIAAHREEGIGVVPGLLSGDYVCVIVTDSGTGMDETTLKRATEPFFTTKGVGKGTGLGLPMVHGLVAQSGGAMRIASEVAKGTSVRLWLPVDPTGVVSPSAVPEVRAQHTLSLKILVVDDDSLISSSTAAMLDDLGHVVVEASSAAAALEIVRSKAPIDVVITDHAMPNMTGLELAGILREQWPWIPVILASGYTDLMNTDDIPFQRLAKPYHQAELASCITRVLEDQKVIPIDAARRMSNDIRTL